MKDRKELDQLLDDIRQTRERVLSTLIHVTEDDFSLPTDMERWTDVRRVLLRFGDHMREHANQIEGTREQNSHLLTMPQRMLAEAEAAWGKLLASTVGLGDEDIDTVPLAGGWTVRQVLEHVLRSENLYFEAVIRALECKNTK